MADEQIEVGTAVAERPRVERPDVRTGVDVNALMMAALQEGEGAVASLEKLVDMEERLAKREAERMFGQQFARFRSALPPIPRTKPGAERSGTRIMYADLETIQAIVDPLLAEHGFVYRFSTEPSKDGAWLIVECILHHEAGHSERSSMPVPMTTIPKASKAQEATGTRTYGKRIALSDVLGISTTDDADGAGPASSDKIDAQTVEELKALADDVGLPAERVAKLLAIFDAKTWADLTEGNVGAARNMIQAARK
jgi:hypothetical protein